ncbi:hypothetical protein Tco_0100198, partial [Tanacetum coccineum]
TEGNTEFHEVIDFLARSSIHHALISAKGEPSVHKDPLFDEILEDTLDYMETEDAQDVGRKKDVVNEEKENVDAEVSTEDVLSTAQEKVSTDTPKVST